MLARAQLARAMCICPSTILIDEGFSAIDEARRDQLLALVQNDVVKRGAIVINVTHHVLDALRASDELVLLSQRPCRVIARYDLRSKFNPTKSGLRSEIDVLNLYAEIKALATECWGRA
jgi:NitT/TauT family transport system ATP-binding protein